MSRAVIYQDDTGRVCIEYDADDGARIRRRFWAPEGRVGYVQELRRDGSTSQPCERLAGTGATLMASRDRLLQVIRREYRRMRAEERAR